MINIYWIKIINIKCNISYFKGPRQKRLFILKHFFFLPSKEEYIFSEV